MKSLQTYLNESLILEKKEIFKSTEAIPLSKIDPKVARKAVQQGLKDGEISDDQVTYKKVSIPVSKLKAAQTEIIPEKAIGMAIGLMLSPKGKIGGDLGSIMSRDNHIMDGHHRWAATYLCDPKARVGGTQINLDGKLLVTALNVITKGKFMRNGNQGSGNIKNFTSRVIGSLLDDYIENGIPGQYPISSEAVKSALGRVPGAKGDYIKGKEIMMKNADALPKQIMKGAPNRIDMPVIQPEEVQDVAKDLSKGVIDITEPYVN